MLPQTDNYHRLISILYLDQKRADSIKSWSINYLFRPLKRPLEHLVRFICLFLISSYRTIITSWVGGSCRFSPSCSEYGQQAFQKFPFTIALKLTLSRIAKCRPGGSFGYDPLPNESRQTLTDKVFPRNGQ